MKILVLNSGSSSLKFKLFDSNDFSVLASGLIEQVSDHLLAIGSMAEQLSASGHISDLTDVDVIGHRVVHGGEQFRQATLINEQTISAIEQLIPLAPLHNPANLLGIQMARQYAPDVVQVAVFDTAFHSCLPDHAYTYGLPYELYQKHHVRRYGFHGTSHQYVSRKAGQFLQNQYQLKKPGLISLHLGNGASAAAIDNGNSIDTSMGMTPLEGLLMGSRSGDLDPAILFYLARETGANIQQLDNLLNKESGLKGICGNNDMRTIISKAEQGDYLSKLAITIFCYRIKKYIGAYIAALNGVDAIIFTGGIGENSSYIRENICTNMDALGIQLNQDYNSRPPEDILELHHNNSKVKLLAIKTNEELEIAQQSEKVLSSD